MTMRIAFALFFSAIAGTVCGQSMFMQRFKLATNDSTTLNVSEVRIAYELSNGNAQLMYSYPYQAINTKTDYDDAVSESCGNLISVSAKINGTTQRVAINPQWINKIYRTLQSKIVLIMRETGTVIEVIGTYESVSAFFDECMGGPGALTFVTHDGTLTGDGTPGSPLKVDTSDIATQYDLTLLRDSTWAKTSGTFPYMNRLITSPIYRKASVRINMTGDSTAFILRYASTQTNPIFRIERFNGTAIAWAHVYAETGSNPSLVFGKIGTFDVNSPNNTVFGLTGAIFASGAGDNTLVGSRAANVMNGGYRNTIGGSRAAQSLTNGHDDAAWGASALQDCTTCTESTAIGRRAAQSATTGSRLTAVGHDALRINTTGSDDVAIGVQACDSCIGSKITAIGGGAGRKSYGNSNVFLGWSAGENSDTASHVLYIANTGTLTPLIGGHFTLQRVGVNTSIANLAQTFNVTGTQRLSGSVTGVDRIMARNASGDIGRLYTGPGISISGDTLYATGTGGNGIYGGDGSLPTGGTDATMGAVGNTLRLISSTGNTTLREMLRFHVMNDAFTRFMVFRTVEDSCRFFHDGSGSSRQFTLQAYGGAALSLACDSTLVYTADSIKTTEGAIKTESKMAFIQGLTPGGVHKRLEGSENGQVPEWNETGGYWEAVHPSSGTLYTVTSTATVAATTTLTSMFGSGVGSLTIPANYMVAGKQFRIKISGVYSTPLVGAGDITVYIKAGGTTLAAGSITTLGVNVTDLEYDIDVIFTCRSTGGAGTLMVTGVCQYSAADETASLRKSLNNGTSTITIDTTASQAINVQVQWSNNTAGNSWSSLNASLEALN